METPPRPDRPVVFPASRRSRNWTGSAYDRLAREVAALLGIDLNQYKPAQVWRRVNGFATARGPRRRRRARGQGPPGCGPAPGVPGHADDQRQRVLPEPGGLGSAGRRSSFEPMLRSQLSVRIWSAGCSLGFEPFTIAMLAREIAPATHRQHPGHRPRRDDPVPRPTGRLHRSSRWPASRGAASAVLRADRQRMGGQARRSRPSVTWRRHDLLADPYERTVRHHLLPQRGHLLHRGGQDGPVQAVLRMPCGRAACSSWAPRSRSRTSAPVGLRARWG